MVILHHRVPVLSPGPLWSRAVDPGVCVWVEGSSIFTGAQADGDLIEAVAAVLGGRDCEKGWPGRGPWPLAREKSCSLVPHLIVMPKA